MGEPFFLLGVERAGLSLVELMLRAHPELAFCGDIDFALAWPEHDEGDWPPLVPYWQHLSLSREARSLGLRIDPKLAFPDLARSLLEQLRGTEQRPFGAAVHAHYARLVRLWPRARFLYLARAAGRPMAISASADAWERLRESDREWRSVAARIAPERRIELRYEKLVAALPTELARVCGFLGVSFDPGLLRVPAAELDARQGATPRPARPPLLSRMRRFAAGLRLPPPARD